MTKEEQWIKESIENFIFAYTGKRAKISDADAQHFTASVMSYLNLCTPSLPSGLDEAAKEYCSDNTTLGATCRACFRDGAEWLAGRGVTKEAVIGMATEEISINVSQRTLNKLDLCPGDKVVVQIRKK